MHLQCLIKSYAMTVPASFCCELSRFGVQELCFEVVAMHLHEDFAPQRCIGVHHNCAPHKHERDWCGGFVDTKQLTTTYNNRRCEGAATGIR